MLRKKNSIDLAQILSFCKTCVQSRYRDFQMRIKCSILHDNYVVTFYVLGVQAVCQNNLQISAAVNAVINATSNLELIQRHKFSKGIPNLIGF